MEIDMDKELIATQQQLTSVLDSLIEQMNLLRNVFLRNEAPIVGPGDGPFVEDKKQTFVFEPPAQAALDNVTISNNKLVETNTKLIDSLNKLAFVMGHPTTTQPTETRTLVRPEGLIDNSPFRGILAEQ
jgi:hypothetical protein